MGRIRIAVVFVFVSAAACSAPGFSTSNDQGVEIVEPGSIGEPNGLPASPADPSTIGVDLVPLHIAAFIFGVPTAEPQIQPGSAALAGSLGSRKRLQVHALPSGPGTAAVHFVEVSPPGYHWGEVMFPAERTVFREFAGDASLGSYIVVLTDVQVVGSPDPVPLTAYRWTRADVEAYASCGIPNRAIDACTSDFYATAEMSIINTAGALRGL